MNPVIQTENVLYSFKGKPALAGVSIEASAGAIVALLGANGAGKSTLMRILAGHLKPQGGKARLLGLDCFHHSLALRLRVAYLPEKPKFFDWMTVAQAGWFASGFYPIGYEPRYLAACERLQLDPGKKLAELSKGGYAKVGLALALAIDPEVLLLDEPTSGLDLFTRRDFLAGMVDLAAQGKTVFISSHGVAEIERVASQVIFLEEGKVVLAGSLAEVRGKIRRVRTEGKPKTESAGGGKILRQESDGPWVTTWYLGGQPGINGQGWDESNQLSLEEMYQVLLGKNDPREVLA
ncbi:MAG: ABC transporter ATP-binding protein [Gemmataceae bacterium]|nr:ABC transporter ATP-binding protein [Gemmataceae bacterium]